MWWYVVHSWHRSIGGTCFAVEKSFENSSWEVRAAAMLSPIHHHQHHGHHRHLLIYCIGYYIVWGLAFTPCEPGARGTRWVAKRGWDCQTFRGALFFVIQLSQLRVVCYYWAQEPMGNCYGLLCLPVGQVVFSIWELKTFWASLSISEKPESVAHQRLIVDRHAYLMIANTLVETDADWAISVPERCPE